MAAIRVEDGGAGGRVNLRDAAAGEIPFHAEFLEGTFLNLQELGLDLDLANIVVAGEDIADTLYVARGLRDDDRGAVVGEARAGDGLEVDARLLEKGFHGTGFARAAGRLASGTAGGEWIGLGSAGTGDTAHAQNRGAGDREESRIERGDFTAGTNDHGVGLYFKLVADGLGDEIEDAFQRGIAEGDGDGRVLVGGIEEDDVDALRIRAAGVEFLGGSAEGGDDLADLGAGEAHARKNNVVQFASQRSGGGGLIGLARALLVNAGTLPTLGDFFEELGAGFLTIEGAGLGFFLSDPQEETLGDGIIRLVRLNPAEGGLRAIGITGDVLRATLGDEFGGGGALGDEAGIDAGGGSRLRFGAGDALGDGRGAGIGRSEFGLSREGGASAVHVAAFQEGLGAIEERGGFFFFQVGNQLLGQRIYRKRGECGVDGGDRIVGAAVADLGAGGGELRLSAGDGGADAVGLGAGHGLGLLLGSRRAARRRWGLAGLRNLDIDHPRSSRCGTGERGSGLGGGAGGGFGLSAALGVELGTEAEHGRIVRGEGDELVERPLRGVEIAGIAGAQDLRHEANFHIGRAGLGGVSDRRGERENRDGEEKAGRRRKGGFVHCGKLLGGGRGVRWSGIVSFARGERAAVRLRERRAFFRNLDARGGEQNFFNTISHLAEHEALAGPHFTRGLITRRRDKGG